MVRVGPRGIRALGALLGVLLLTPAHAPAASAFLAARDDIVVDGRGRHVLLRGINHIGLRSDRNHPLDPHADPATLFTLEDLEQADFDAIASLGFNSVRLVVSWEFAQPDPPPAPYAESYFGRIDDAIRKAADAGMTTIFDFAQFGWGRSVGGNAGAPAWTVPASCSQYPQQPPNAPPQASPRVGCVFYNFWTNGGGLQEHYVALWRFVAARYAGDPNVSMYDLFNEPVGGPIPPGIFEHGFLYPIYQRLAAAIREEDPNHIVAFQPPVTRSIGVPSTFAAPLGIENSIYAPHSYTLAYAPQRLDPGYTAGDTALLLQDSAALVAEAAVHQAPLVVGENGWTRSTHADGVGGPVERTDPGAPPAYAVQMATFADDLVMSWHWFAYSSIDAAYGINHGGTLDEQLARVLARPFPRATAGRVTSITFHPGTGVYRQTTTDTFDERSELALPITWRYPNGVVITIDGEHVATIDGTGTIVAAEPGVSFEAARALLTLPRVGADLVITPRS